MQQLSVVIVCKNEAAIIGTTLQSLQGLTDDIVVYDNGSTDGTQELVKQFPVRIYEGTWEGFGKTKNKAIAQARYDWILNIDADETIDEELKRSLKQVQPENEKTVYEMAFSNFFGSKPLKHGEWGTDYHIRLFNRRAVQWNESAVHESLVLPAGVIIKRLKGNVLHYTLRDIDSYRQKMEHYAELSARKYHEQGRSANWFKLHLSPGFSFIRNYIFKLGFLDGREGYSSAKMTAWYTRLKYKKLKELNAEQESRYLSGGNG
ncbi:MAG TPA: glycosyltransferase family 2 protein [Chitinophagaceae bacterium]|nr:glycosyltransferase family 2 protein [Chitinophagaceae bacterium]